MAQVCLVLASNFEGSQVTFHCSLELRTTSYAPQVSKQSSNCDFWKVVSTYSLHSFSWKKKKNNLVFQLLVPHFWHFKCSLWKKRLLPCSRYIQHHASAEPAKPKSEPVILTALPWHGPSILFVIPVIKVQNYRYFMCVDKCKH